MKKKPDTCGAIYQPAPLKVGFVCRLAPGHDGPHVGANWGGKGKVTWR